MEATFRIAIIGCGWAGRRHAEACKTAGVLVRWAVDTNVGRARAVQGLHPNARVTANYRDAIADPDVNAVDICLPHALHAAVTLDAARAGKHVLCEKPMAATLEEADQMIAATEHAQVTLMIAENVRFDPLLRKVADLLNDGIIGRPALIQVNREAYLNQSFLEERRWFLKNSLSAGGIMMSGGVHDIEKLRMLVGEVESIQAVRVRQRFTQMEGDDTSVALVRFCDGTTGVMIESFMMMSLATAAGSEVHTLRIDGELGSLVVPNESTIRIYTERPGLWADPGAVQHDLHVASADTFALEMEHFVNSIRRGEEPLTSGRWQRRPLQVVLAAYESMRTGQSVRV